MQVAKRDRAIPAPAHTPGPSMHAVGSSYHTGRLFLARVRSCKMCPCACVCPCAVPCLAAVLGGSETSREQMRSYDRQPGLVFKTSLLPSHPQVQIAGLDQAWGPPLLPYRRLPYTAQGPPLPLQNGHHYSACTCHDQGSPVPRLHLL